MATKKITEQLPERPAVIEQSSIIKSGPRPTGLAAIEEKDPTIGLNLAESPETFEQQIAARQERYEKIKAAGGGDFRLIHGTMQVPLSREELFTQDGMRKENVRPFRTAVPGDIVRLSVDDAFRALEQGLVEELDAKPSRLGKVFTPPKVVQQFGGHAATPPSKTAESRP